MNDTSTKPISPHPVLPEYYPDEPARQQRINTMFDGGAAHYDWINRVMSFGSGRWYRKNVLRRGGLKSGMRLADIGCGTGVISLLAQDIVGETGDVVAVDPSEGMLAQARAAGVRKTLRGRGADLPLPDDEFDLLTMGYALRHVEDLVATFREYRRILKPGGKVLLLEITKPKSCVGRMAMRAYLYGIVPLVVRIFRRSEDAETMMRYFWDTIDQCVAPKVIAGALRDAGFRNVERNHKFGVLSEYTGVKTG